MYSAMTDNLTILAARTKPCHESCINCRGSGLLDEASPALGPCISRKTPLIPGLRKFPCDSMEVLDDMNRLRHFHNGVGWMDSCPGYTTPSPAEALTVLLDWARERKAAVIFDQYGVEVRLYSGIRLPTVAFQEWLPSTADTVAAALCKVLGLEERASDAEIERDPALCDAAMRGEDYLEQQARLTDAELTQLESEAHEYDYASDHPTGRIANAAMLKALAIGEAERRRLQENRGGAGEGAQP